MRKPRAMTLALSLAVALSLLLGLGLPAMAQVGPPPPPDLEPGVLPETVVRDLAPGESAIVEKLVTTPLIPPKPDIYFMADTTGSMGEVIGAVQADIATILGNISGSQPTALFGAGQYKDFPSDAFAFNNDAPIGSDDGVGGNPDASDAVASWSASGGGDGPEGQFYALTRIADPADPEGIAWRTDSTRIVVWFGDAPAHDPVPTAATGLGSDITEATVTADLVAAGIKVIAISTVTAAGAFYPNALDDDPNNFGGDYAAAYGILEDGTPGQASRIAAATGGIHLAGVTPEQIAQAIVGALEELTTDVWWEVTSIDPGLTVTLDPIVHLGVPGGTTVTFTETITVAEDAPQCGEPLTATVTFFADSFGSGEGPVVGVETITVDVLDVTPPTVESVETVNPHAKTVPPAGSTTLPGPKGGMNEDGFYELIAEDNCDPDPEIFVGTADDPFLFGPFASGIVVKLTEDADALPEQKQMGSTNGQAGAVAWHIILPTDALITAVDDAGNTASETQLVPPPPK